MPGFDIATLEDFQPPSTRCPYCLALWSETPSESFYCPVCETYFSIPLAGYQWNGLTYGGAVNSYPAIQVGPFQSVGSSIFSVSGPGRSIDLGDDPLQHAQRLAVYARELRAVDDDMPPLRALMRLLLSAQSFVHLTTFNLDNFTLGMLETIAQLHSVSAAVSGLDDRLSASLEPVPKEAPLLDLRIEALRSDRIDQNHTKLIIVDGIVAVQGSANLTHHAWRKAAMSMELVDVVTDVDRVRELNNRYFSPLWARLTPSGQELGPSLGTWQIFAPDDVKNPRNTTGGDAGLTVPSDSP